MNDTSSRESRRSPPTGQPVPTAESSVVTSYALHPSLVHTRARLRARRLLLTVPRVGTDSPPAQVGFDHTQGGLGFRQFVHELDVAGNHEPCHPALEIFVQILRTDR